MNDTPRSRILLRLFTTMFTISAFTFGGGFVIVTFMKRRFVDELHWLDEEEMPALAQSCPGAIAVNAAILVGRKMAGTAGMACAVAGTVLPPLIIISVISLFYAAFSSSTLVRWVLQGMQCGVAMIILDAALNLGMKVLKQRRWIHPVIMASAFVCTFFLHINVVLILLASALIGVGFALSARKGGEKV